MTWTGRRDLHPSRTCCGCDIIQVPAEPFGPKLFQSKPISALQDFVEKRANFGPVGRHTSASSHFLEGPPLCTAVSCFTYWKNDFSGQKRVDACSCVWWKWRQSLISFSFGAPLSWKKWNSCHQGGGSDGNNRPERSRVAAKDPAVILGRTAQFGWKEEAKGLTLTWLVNLRPDGLRFSALKTPKKAKAIKRGRPIGAAIVSHDWLTNLFSPDEIISAAASRQIGCFNYQLPVLTSI